MNTGRTARSAIPTVQTLLLNCHDTFLFNAALVFITFFRYFRGMSMTIEQLATEALSLPSESRALLAEQLVESLDAFVPASRVDELWAAEAQRRLAEIRSGRAQTIPGEEAAERVRRAVGR